MTRILIVEDNEMNRDMLSRRLAREGFDVDVATDGAEALSKVEQCPPSLVLMDLSLPNLDGWEATRRLKANPDTKRIPVIVLTAHALEHERIKALETGCDDFDVKPVKFKRLMGKINQHLGDHNAQ